MFSHPELMESTVSFTLTDCTNEVGSLCIPHGCDIEKGTHSLIFFPGSGSLHDLDHVVREMASVGVLGLCDVIRDGPRLSRLVQVCPSSP